MRRRLLLYVCLLIPRLAAAQAPPAAPPPPPPREEGSAELAFVGTTGNSSTSTLSVGGEHIVRPTNWVIRNRTAFVRNEAEDVLTAESFLYVFRASRVISPRAAAFGEYGYFSDEFAGVDHRNAITGGLSYKVVDMASQQWSVDGGLGYLNEQRLTGDDISSAMYFTGSNYQWKISPTATFEDEARLTGTFARAEDWRFLHIASVTARLTELLSLKVSHTIRYANFPPPTFKTTDTTTSIALVAKFSRN